MRLTRGGVLYHDAVVAGLARIGAADAALAGIQAQHVVIACGHVVSTLFVMPLREKLYPAVGGGATDVHILTCDDDLLARVGESEADLVLGFDPGDGVSPGGGAGVRVRVCRGTRGHPARGKLHSAH